jgi:hypothetical protein
MLKSVGAAMGTVGMVQNIGSLFDMQIMRAE